MTSTLFAALRLRFAFFRWLAVLLLATITTVQASPQDQKPVEHFSAESATLYKSEKPTVKLDGADVVFLEDQETFSFDGEGKVLRTTYSVYRILTQRGAEEWNAVSVGWEPWRESRPTIRARVISADGVVHELDSKTITDSPAKESEDSVYSDRRVMRAPLPAVAQGAIVERETVHSVSPAFAGAGLMNSSYFGGSVPAQHSVLVLEAPVSLPLRYKAQLLDDVKPQKSEENGRVRIVFDAGPRDALVAVEPYLPSDVPRYPNVTFSTAVSWQQIAADYEAIVERQLAQADLKTIVAKLTAGKTTRDEKAAAIMRYLDREVRYTGVEFSEASVVPRSPSETLTRKYGDCKDKAALLVALLRTADIPAYVALLYAGGAQDVDPDLPGADMFDHVIVFVPGPPSLWIDATDEYARLREVPNMDQQRYALVAHAGGSGLVRTPLSSSADNLFVEKREFFLAEYGPSRVVETSQPHGSTESYYRHTWVDVDSKEARESLNKYVQGQYAADKLDRASRSDPEDLSKQFELVLESKTAHRGYTSLNSAEVVIRLEGLFDDLPAQLQTAEKEKKGETTDATNEQPAKKRTADWQLPFASAIEWQYTIVPPAGFKPQALPENQKMSVGPATLAQEYVAQKDGVVQATLRFELPQRQITAAQASGMRDQIVQLKAAEPVVISFEPLGQALLKQGKVREAIASYQQAIAVHPKQAVPHLRLADTLVSAGMGEAARSEARTAVQLEPNSALAQRVLASVLQYDLVGRKFRSGSDYAGAEAAYRAAIRLDPDEETAPANLAILFEHNAQGERYVSGARLKQAIAQYQRIGQEKLAENGLADNLSFALFYDQQFAEARKLAEQLNPQPNGLVVACDAALHGSQSAIAEAHRRTQSEEKFSETVKTAGQMLLSLRKYPLAADLLQAGATGSNASQTEGLASILRTLVPREERKLGDDPGSVVIESFLLLGDQNATLDKYKAMSSRNARWAMDHEDPDKIKETLNGGNRIRTAATRAGLPGDVMLDIMVGMMKPSAVGTDQSGYKVTTSVFGDQTMVMFVVKEDGRYKVLDTTDEPNALGLEVLDRVKANNLDGARVLLDWLREDQHLVGGDDPLVGPVFPRFWTRGNPGDAEQMKLAAAAILVSSDATAAVGIPILEAAKPSATSDSAKANIALALAVGYRLTKQYDKELAETAELTRQFPDSTWLFHAQVGGYFHTGQFEAAEKLAQARLARLPGDADAQRSLVNTAVAQENYSKAQALDQDLLKSGKAAAGDFNGAAWHALFTGGVGPVDLENALKATQMKQNDPNILHTLGCVYAEMGKTKEAREILIQAMELANLEEPDSAYWYAFGLLAEQYGLRDTALADYARVSKPKDAIQIPDSTYRLASLRTQAMKTGQHPLTETAEKE